MRNETEIVEACLHGMRTGRPDRAPLAADVTWEGPPASGKLIGAKVLKLLSRLSPLIGTARVERHIVEGPYVATLFEVDAPAGSLGVVVCFRLANGLVKEIRVFCDPRDVRPESILQEGDATS